MVGQMVAYASWLRLHSSSTQYMTTNRSKLPALNPTTSKTGTGMRLALTPAWPGLRTVGAVADAASEQLPRVDLAFHYVGAPTMPAGFGHRSRWWLVKGGW